MWSEITNAINQNNDSKFELINYKSIGGGCINQAYQLIGKDKSYFVKLNNASKIEMFLAEVVALEEIYHTNTIIVPKPICYGVSGNNSYLVLEYLNLGRGDSQSWGLLGQKLALLHQIKIKKPFGWHRNNTIGSTPQINNYDDNWANFFAEKRIGYQLKLANRRGGNFTNPQEIIEKVRSILTNHNPFPSLVHGDLWSGNAGFKDNGEGVVFDPACYYGDREVDIAMTELFGGFPSIFYEGYNHQWALDKGYNQRKTIYNLYHILNHFNLFGGSYESQAKTIIMKISNP
ncbi:ribulosamine/erythrulosamine 3-kinase [Geminocystis sp. NIES-3708]|uniref:fructosamine kinase family protein n=1 Tax=Geminocystis sp. NIES-3708 TaxID=1615909 RepID=UPI0005FC7756|nr:fructosamine kinase family protein [Geminocystis sp. NIES-3708]BAQ60829.1 ribulosamine/erythrulosamine 3-kinase [Geminocystis sp. NIES-3708]